MHKRSRGGRDAFSNFGDPFTGFGGFPGRGSLISSFFGGRDPFDDPFFRNPLGSMFESSFFGSFGSPFGNMHESRFLEHQATEPKRPRGPIIEEINSDDEKEDAEGEENTKNPIQERVIEDLDEDEEKGNKHLQLVGHHSAQNHRHFQSQPSSFTFQSSSVTYGSSNGTYYSSSRTRRMGSDGVTFEESKEADTASRQATHKISRGLHNKGHTITRKLNSDGMVDTMQTLHNLNADDLRGFENAWAKNARSLLGNTNGYDNMGGIGQIGQASRGCRALPDTQHHPGMAGRMTIEDCSNSGSSSSQRLNKSKKKPIYRNA